MPSDNGLEDVQGVSVDNVVHNATASDNGCVSGADNSVVSKIFSTKKINVVLNDNNYLLWHQQVLLTIKTHRLLKFIDDNVTWPPQYVNKDGVVSINPDYELYEEQDGTLASWLLSTVSEEVLPHLIGHNTASEIWNTLHRLYSGKTTSRLMTYRRLLHSQKKGDLTMRDYLMKLKSVCDSLASCGENISEQEHVTAILNGLPPEYDSVIIVITANPSPSDLRIVRTILLDAESRQVNLIDQYPVSAHVVVQQQQQQTSNTSVFTASHAQSIQPAYTNNQHGSEDPWGRGRGRFSSSRPQCQLCGKPGHLVERCYRRFDISFKNDSSRAPQHSGNRAPQALYSVLGSDGVSSGNMMYYYAPVSHHVSQLPSQNQFVPAIAHSTPSVSFPPPIVVVAGSTMVQQASTPQALIATPEVVDDNAWYPDSGATHHLTKDVSSLQVGSTYPSTGMVQVGNGNTIPIRFVGQSVLLNGSRNLHLQKLLYVPNITKNLLSVSKFTQDNQVLLEFYPKCCKVKDLVTKKVLLEGSESGGLYQLNLSSFQSNSIADNHSLLLNKVACHKSFKAGTFLASFFFKQQRYLSPSHSSPLPQFHAIPPTSTPHQLSSPSQHLHAIPSGSSPHQSPSPSPHLHDFPSTSPPLQSSSPSPHLHAISSTSPPHQSSSPSPHLHATSSISPPHQSSSPSQHLHDSPSNSSPHQSPSSSSHSHATPSVSSPQQLSPPSPHYMLFHLSHLRIKYHHHLHNYMLIHMFHLHLQMRKRLGVISSDEVQQVRLDDKGDKDNEVLLRNEGNEEPEEC
ncbi:hypothetical protein GQ457_01G001570 [Hibiscus cannabinus]